MRSRAARSGFLLAALSVPIACAEPAPPHNAILIVLDTLRADALSAYGNPRETTPVIDSLAEKGVLFENVVTNATWTLPALTGLLSGRYPTLDVYEGKLRVSLVEHLRDAGWETAAFSEGGWFSKSFGLDLGFDVFWNPLYMVRQARAASGRPATDIEETFQAVRSWLGRRRPKPFFLVVHTYEAHTPYRRLRYAEGMDRGRLTESEYTAASFARFRMGLEPGETELAYVRALYDGGAARCDRAVSSLLDALEELGLADDTLMVITADHGEDLGEHRTPGSHGQALYDQTALVPLIIVDPTRQYPVKRVKAQVRSVDTMHTVLDLIGAPAVPADERQGDGAGQHGRSLVPLMKGDEDGDRLALLRTVPFAKFDYQAKWSVRTPTHKLIVSEASPGKRETPPVELYDLVADPGERTNLAARDSPVKDDLLAQLEAFEARLDAVGPPRYDGSRPAPEVEEQLRALGYVQ